jgi:tRNA-splicing ligase RtcB (3'-phosphate/5'-hydroxy nucleic acid ligase)
VRIEKRDDCIWEIPREGGMRVPGRIIASDALMESIRDDPAVEQVANVAHLPGIVGYSWAMPDMHLGYGFPIGGVAATAFDEDGVISPGGVGYDINCGVRLVASGLTRDEVAPRIVRLMARLFEQVPCGPNPRQSAMGELSAKETRRALRDGARYAIARGFGRPEDLECCEENGALSGAAPDAVSDAAIDRGRGQLGSVGSGNHFLEVGYVSRVFAPEVARVLGLEEGTVTLLIHCGSRGLGHQVCTDFLREMAAAPLDSELGRRYLGAMNAAANFAWANRQALMVLAERVFAGVFAAPPDRLGFRLVYDVSHNLAKTETHRIAGVPRRVCVHRKGATRSLPPGDERVPAKYRGVGQPVLVPGDMGTASHVCVGAAFEGEHPFHSSCHGAGRRLSRRSATRLGAGRSIVDELKQRGIVVMAKDRRTLAEEMPDAYKDVAEVVGTLVRVGLVRQGVEIRPLGVIKG